MYVCSSISQLSSIKWKLMTFPTWSWWLSAYPGICGHIDKIHNTVIMSSQSIKPNACIVAQQLIRTLDLRRHWTMRHDPYDLWPSVRNLGINLSNAIWHAWLISPMYSATALDVIHWFDWRPLQMPSNVCKVKPPLTSVKSITFLSPSQKTTKQTCD